MCSFSKTKYVLILLNTMYLIAGAGLLFIITRAKLSCPPVEMFSTEKVIIVCEILTMIIAIFGIFATLRQHQVILFFYMFILFFLLIIQFEFSYETLAASSKDYREMAQKNWDQMSASSRSQYMDDNRCNPFTLDERSNSSYISSIHLSNCISETGYCPSCEETLISTLKWWHKLIGLWGCTWSVLEILGVSLTKHYRNLKDPRSHPSAFL